MQPTGDGGHACSRLPGYVYSVLPGSSFSTFNIEALNVKIGGTSSSQLVVHPCQVAIFMVNDYIGSVYAH